MFSCKIKLVNINSKLNMTVAVKWFVTYEDSSLSHGVLDLITFNDLSFL